MESHLRAGIAIYNAGEYHAAHDAWEDRWLELDQNTDDERFLHGLIQFTAAIHHAQDANWEGVRGLAESAAEYLRDLPADYRETNIGDVRTYLKRVAADPEHVERVAPPNLVHEGVAVLPEDLTFDEAAIAAEILAEELSGYETETIQRGITFAREDLADGRAASPFVTLVMDFARDKANRGIIYQRLVQHTGRRNRKRRDVEGLFD